MKIVPPPTRPKSKAAPAKSRATKAPKPHKRVSVQPTLAAKNRVAGARVASRVPALQIYAIVILILGLYSFYHLLAIGPMMGGLTVSSQLIWILILLMLPSAINISAGVYFLLARRPRIVGVVIPILLIVGGLSLLFLIVSMFSQFAAMNARSIIMTFALATIYLYLWGIKSQVDALE